MAFRRRTYMHLGTLLIFSALGLGAAQVSSVGDSPDVNPAVTRDDVRIVQRAHEILNSPAKWNRADNRNCAANATTYSLYCALEIATKEISKTFEHRGAAMQQARFVIDEDLAKGNHYDHRLMDYNNDPKTTFADVQRFFNLLERRIQKQLDTQQHR
jgi:hypothetical protein